MSPLNLQSPRLKRASKYALMENSLHNCSTSSYPKKTKTAQPL